MEQQLSSAQIYSGPAISLRVDKVRKPSGVTTTRDVVEHSDCVAVVPIDDQNQVLLVRQFRYPVDASLLEVPAGGIEPGEDVLDCVRRELQEEIGYLPGQDREDSVASTRFRATEPSTCMSTLRETSSPVALLRKIPTRSRWSGCRCTRCRNSSSRARCAMPSPSPPAHLHGTREAAGLASR